jgi:hypothetical protein
LADWDLLHSRSGNLTGSAVATYEQAYEFARERGGAKAWIDKTFSPEIPIVLPTFWPNPLATEETAESTGHIDVAFDVTKDGRSRRVEIVNTTSHATRADKNALIRLIKRSRFRPRVAGGRFGDDSVLMRYHF